MILTHFPRSYPDELLYSRLARWHLQSGSNSPKHTMEDLFGTRDVRASIDLQCHLGALAERVSRLTPCSHDDLLQQTLFGYFTAYVPSPLVEKAKRSMISGKAAGLHARLGIAAGARNDHPALKWCKQCMERDVGRYGEGYWHRAHQLPSVLVCPEHAALLRAAILPHLTSQHAFVAADTKTCPHDAPSIIASPLSDHTLSSLKWLAVKSAELLDQKSTFPNHTAIQALYKTRLIDFGFALPSGRLRIDELLTHVARTLAPMRDIFVEVHNLDWVAAIGRKHRKSFRPLQHLLFELALDEGPKGIVTGQPQRQARSYLANSKAFEAQLRQAVAEAPSLRAAARQVAVDTRTVIRHVTRLGLKPSWLSEKHLSTPDQLEKADVSAAIKARWLAGLDPQLSRTQLRQKMPSEWVWLRRHAPEWLAQNQPPRAQRISARPPRYDWTSIDERLSEEIYDAAKLILASNPPCRVTLAEIERKLGKCGWLLPRKSKLPLSMAALAQVSEGVDTYRLRRLHWAASHLIRQGLPSAPWRISRAAGLPQKRSQAVSAALGGYDA